MHLVPQGKFVTAQEATVVVFQCNVEVIPSLMTDLFVSV